MDILNKLISLGTKKITWTGGNPLLYNGLYNLIRHAKTNEIKTALATNGTQLNEEVLNLLDGIIDTLIIPLDAADPSTQSIIGRPYEHFELIMSILNIVSKNNYKFKIRINTVVSRHNISNLLKLADKISTHKVDIWKIYQFAPLRGRAKTNQHIHSVDNQMFTQTKDNILLHPVSSNVDISFCDNDELQNDNLLIAPNGDIIRTMDCKDNILGNIKLNIGDFVHA